MNRYDNCLSYWFPKLVEHNLPVPKTEIITTDIELGRLLDRELPNGYDEFITRLEKAGDNLGYPCFLRTGHTSGKHDWKNTCFIPNKKSFKNNVSQLIVMSETCDVVGLAYNVWAVREFLPTKPISILPSYGGMPLCREFRGFTLNGKVECIHPYWPTDSVIQGFPVSISKMNSNWDQKPIHDAPPSVLDELEKINQLTPDEHNQVTELIHRAGKAVPGHWSVDILWTHNGWYVTDMAMASMSYHWPDCKNTG